MSYADTLLSTGERIIHREQAALVRVRLGRPLHDPRDRGRRRLLLPQQRPRRRRHQRRPAVRPRLDRGRALPRRPRRPRLDDRCTTCNQEYVLTNRRVMQVGGVLNKHSADSSLEKINDAVLKQSLFGRMFDFGDLDVLTAADSGIDKFRMLRGPIDFKKAMLDAKHEYEVDMERQSWPPTPPLKPAAPDPFTGEGGDRREPTVSPTPAATAAPAAAAAAPRDLQPDEVTRTLGEPRGPARPRRDHAPRSTSARRRTCSAGSSGYDYRRPPARGNA